MASTKQGYPVVSRMLAERPAALPEPAALKARLDHELRARVHEVVRLTSDDRRGRRASPRRRHESFWRRDSSTGCRILNRWHSGPPAPGWRWKVWR